MRKKKAFGCRVVRVKLHGLSINEKMTDLPFMFGNKGKLIRLECP